MKTLVLSTVLLTIAYIVNAQNVGIGTDAPESKLHVAGVMRADALLLNIDTSDAELLRFETGTSLIEQDQAIGAYFGENAGWQSFTATTDGEFLTVSISFTQTPMVSLVKVYQGEGTNGTELYSGSLMHFQNGWLRMPTMQIPIDSGSMYTVWLDEIRYAHVAYLAYPGGRCSTDPSYDLRFKIYVADEVPISIEGQGPGRLVLPSSSSVIEVNGSVNSEQLYIKEKMGIGTDAPDRPLTIRPSTAQLMSFQGLAGQTLWNWWMPYSTELRLSSGNSTDNTFSVLPSGRIGIGTGAPTHRLHVLSPATDQVISRFSSLGGYGEIVVDNGSQQVDLGAYTGGGYVGSLSTGDFHIRTGSVSRIFLQHNTGNVGIGELAPEYKLQVSGTDKLFRIGGSAGEYGTNVLFSMAGTGTFSIDAPNVPGGRFFLHGTSGHLGIGTPSPQHRLHVWSGLDPVVARFSSTAGYGEIVVDNGSQGVDLGAYNGGGFVGSLYTGDFHIRTGSVSRIFLQHSTGNVGIGTEAPGAKLDVNGDIKISGRIQNEAIAAPVLLNNWVDYGNGFETSGYYKDKEGVVHLRGLVKSGTAALITTLPEGYRPAGTHLFTVVSGNSFSRLDINSAGNVELLGPYQVSYVSLSGISFRVD